MGWGERNGTRKQIIERNNEIISRFRKGESIHSLMEKYHLGYDSIRKIVSPYRKKKFPSVFCQFTHSFLI